MSRWVFNTMLAVNLAFGAGSQGAARPDPGEIFSDCDGCPEMVVIPRGTFRMGGTSEPSRKDDLPVREVTVPAFAVARTEVTHAQYEMFVDEIGLSPLTGCTTDVNRDGRWQFAADKSWRDPGFPVGKDYPVTCMNWYDAEDYAEWLSVKTGQRYRLLSEAEYEYALRGGTTTEFFWGDDPEGMCVYANGPDAHVMSLFPNWHSGVGCQDGYDFLAPVAQFKPNPFGLYDMAGNAWEWTADCYVPGYDVQPNDGSAYAEGACGWRTTRGGSMGYAIHDFRSAQRNFAIAPYLRGGDVGFRVARDL